jgi:hypothetical protein
MAPAPHSSIIRGFLVTADHPWSEPRTGWSRPIIGRRGGSWVARRRPPGTRPRPKVAGRSSASRLYHLPSAKTACSSYSPLGGARDEHRRSIVLPLHMCVLRAHVGQYQRPEPVASESLSARTLAWRTGSWCHPTALNFRMAATRAITGRSRLPQTSALAVRQASQRTRMWASGRPARRLAITGDGTISARLRPRGQT